MSLQEQNLATVNSSQNDMPPC